MRNRLRRHLSAWKRLNPGSDILRIVRFGLRFELTAPPRVAKRGPTFRGSPAQKHSLMRTLREWLELGVIEPTASAETLQSLLFPVPKRDDWRWVLDSREFNESIKRHHFRMEGIAHVRSMLRRGDWLASIDLKDAFLHVPIHRKHRRYLAFRAFGRQYRFAAMSFGTSCAPRVFTRLMKPVLAQLHKWGIRATIYLDDMLIAAPSEVQCALAVTRAKELLLSLGFQINWDKSTLLPTQRLQHLGFVLNTHSFRISVPRDKVMAMRKEARRLLRRNDDGSLTIRQLAGLAGKMVAAAPAMRVLDFRRHSLHRCVAYGLRASHGNWDATVSLSATALRDLRWLTTKSVLFLNGAPLALPEPDAILTTDASPTGWGATLQLGARTIKTFGFFTSTESQQSSNWRETTAITRAFFSFRRRLRPKSCLLVLTDNTTALSALRRYGSRWRHLGQAIDPMLRACLRMNLVLHASHIAGVDNEAADELSRRTRPLCNEWSLSREAYRLIVATFATPTIDWFATHINAKVRRFVSRMPDPRSVGVDALRMDWTAEFGLFVPPFNLLPLVVSRLHRSGAAGIVVVPFWPTRPWFGQLIELARAPLLRLPGNALQPIHGHHPMRDEHAPPLVAVLV